MKNTGQRLLVLAMLAFLLPFTTPAPSYSAQMMQLQGSGRVRTVAPSVTRVSPARAKTIHMSTPKSLLVVKKLYILPKNPHLGDRVAIHARVANNGSKDVKNVKVAFYLGKKQVAWAVYDIKPRTARNYRGFFTKREAPKAGSYTVSAMVDPDRALERRFYSCNSATLKITIGPPMVRKIPERPTINKSKISSQPRTRHAFIRPGAPLGKGETPARNREMKPRGKSLPVHPSASRPPVRPIRTGQIKNVTVRPQARTKRAPDKIRRGTVSHDLEVRWARLGMLSERVDIYLMPFRHAGRKLCLRRNVANNGHVILPVPGMTDTRQRYVVRVQTRDRKVHGDSRPFYPVPPKMLVSTKTHAPGSQHISQVSGKLYGAYGKGPRITHFHAPARIFEKEPPVGIIFYVPYFELPLSIDWTDPDQNLAGGQYRFTLTGFAAGGNEIRDDGWQPLKNPQAYKGNKGKGHFLIKVIPRDNFRNFTYTLQLRDRAGNTSNLIKGKGTFISFGERPVDTMKTSKNTVSPGTHTASDREISHVTARILTHRNPGSKNETYTFDVHWTWRGISTPKLNIIFFPAKHFDHLIFLKRKAANNGHCKASYFGKISLKQGYVVQVVTLDGNVRGNSDVIYLDGRNYPSGPRITFFHAPADVYDKDPLPATIHHFHVPAPPQLPLSIYWKDADGDMMGGKYRFAYTYPCNSMPGEKIDSGWKPLPAGHNYTGKKGMDKYLFELMAHCAPEAFTYTFTLMDRAGHISNTIKGTLHWHQDEAFTGTSPQVKPQTGSDEPKVTKATETASRQAAGLAKNAQSNRGAKGSKVAATPISIPRPIRPHAGAVKTVGRKNIHPGNPMTTYDTHPNSPPGNAPPGGGAWGYDFSCKLGRVNGTVPVEKENPKIHVQVFNHGISQHEKFTVGLGLKSKARIGKPGSWLAKHDIYAGAIYAGKWIYADFDLPKGVTEKTELVAAVDVFNVISEKDENNNFSKAFRIKFRTEKKYRGGTDKPDLIPSIKTSNAVYSGDGKTLMVGIWNDSETAARGFSVGFCLAGKANTKDASKWLGSKEIAFLGPHNRMLVSIPWQVHTLGNNEKYVAVTDIFQDIHEGKTGEQNNQTTPFTYQVGTTLVPPPIMGPPIEAFDVSVGPPGKNSFRRDQDRPVAIFLRVKGSIRNNPAMLAQLGDYVRIALIRPDGSEALVIVERASLSQTWYWKIPANAPIGKYRVGVKTQDGHYEGKSKPITIWEPATAKAAKTLEQTDNLVPKPLSIDTKKKLKLGKPYQPPQGIEPLRFSVWKIQSLVPHIVLLNGQYSMYARLSSLDIVIQYHANKPFKFSRLMPTAKYYPDAEWSYAELYIAVAGKLDKPMLFGSNIHDGKFFTGYPWHTYFAMGQKLINHKINYPKGIQPAGTHSITLKLEEIGIVNGVKIVGKIEGSGKKCEVRYLPHIDISVSAKTHTPYASSVEDAITHSFSPPPCWNRVDMVHWAMVYPDVEKAIFRPGECR